MQGPAGYLKDERGRRMSATALRHRQTEQVSGARAVWIPIEPPPFARPVVRLLPPPVELDDFDPDLTPCRVIVRSSEDVDVV